VYNFSYFVHIIVSLYCKNSLNFKVYLGFQTASQKGSRKKNNSSANGQAIKRGGGDKGRAIKEKRTFFKTYSFILLPSKNKNYFT